MGSRSQGLSVLPCNGKKPCCKWTEFQSQHPTDAVIRRWKQLYPEHNIGVVTGPISGISVVDCDDPSLSLEALFDIFGETPLVTRTPSGGMHLFYRYNGEHNGKLGVIRGDLRGEGGFIVLPPSRNVETGKHYQFIIGTEHSFGSLPIMKMQSFAKQMPRQNRLASQFYMGERNNALYKAVHKAASTMHEDELLIYAHEYNQCNMSPPLPPQEVDITVAQIIRYKREGRLMVTGSQSICIPCIIADLLTNNKSALYLFYKLRQLNPDLRKSFAAAAEALSIIVHMSKMTVIKHLKILEQNEIIVRIHKGGKYAGDPARYRWGKILYS